MYIMYIFQFPYLVEGSNTFQCYNGDRHPASAECDGIVDCVGSSLEDELETCRKFLSFSVGNIHSCIFNMDVFLS